jgi:D-arabinose 5-phosphate isomerase GutQ
MWHPRIVRDTLIGDRGPYSSLATSSDSAIRIPVADVVCIDRQQFSKGKSIALVAGFASVMALFYLAAQLAKSSFAY